MRVSASFDLEKTARGKNAAIAAASMLQEIAEAGRWARRSNDVALTELGGLTETCDFENEIAADPYCTQ
ncbi:MAG TPA: hypothetical protein VIW29_09335 [Polyangiaceae bacterium]